GFRLSVSEYLDKFKAPRQLFSDANSSPSQMLYHESCLFEFIANVADEFGTSIQVKSYTIPVPGFDEVNAQVRHIVQPVCRASLLALKVLRAKAKQRIEPEEGDRKGDTQATPEAEERQTLC
ncbi:MAG: hypothetical protein JSW47_21515, partial [Phycisphaerales bacterium]